MVIQKKKKGNHFFGHEIMIPSKTCGFLKQMTIATFFFLIFYTSTYKGLVELIGFVLSKTEIPFRTRVHCAVTSDLEQKTEERVETFTT